MDLRSLVNKLRTRGPSGRKVELKPLEQVVLAFLIRSGGAPAAAIQAVIDERQTVLRHEAPVVMEALLQQGLAEVRFRPEAGDSVFVPTDDGRKLRRRLPENPATVTDFWL